MYITDHAVIRTITSDYEVRGLTMFNGKLHVLRNTTNDQVDVYKMNTEDNDTLYCRDLIVPGDNLWDMTSGTRDRCMYVSDRGQREVYDVTEADDVKVPATFSHEPRGLSMMDNGKLLVTCRNELAVVCCDLLSFDDDSDVCLDETIQQPWHAIQLKTGNFVVCHGSGPSKLHRVCIVDRSGCIIRSFGSVCGSGKLQLNVPCHLAVDKDDFIFVADCLNERVTLLTPTLDFVCHVIEKMDSRPQRLLLTRGRKQLYVGQRNGDVLVLQL